MKVAKIAAMVCAATALAATCSPAGQYKITVSGTIYTNMFSTIYPAKLDNKGIIAQSCPSAGKGAQLLYDTSGESSGTNMLIVADKCGNTLCPIGLLILNPAQTTCISATANNVAEQVCSIPFVGLGGEGTVVVDLKAMVTTKGTNLVGKASGVFISLGSPGVISITISGAFKRPTSGCP
ncbi:MAG: hypothetical protein ABSA97_15835 [Verrucomicrobiia bacterium]